MLRIGLLTAASLAAGLFAISTPVLAKECKSTPVVQESQPYVSRTLGAFPNSLVEWRKAVVDKHGDGWQAWRRSEDKKIDCEQVNVDGRGQRWVCTRSARPCAGPIGPEKETALPFPGRLERGSSGKAVEDLQKLLVEAGYKVTVDGRFGRETVAAVRDFQQKEGIKVDGIVGMQTWERLAS
ncbi:MAG: peptidoglycan-binding protein [Hyphomicrobiaceae bacterium]